jgi:L-threonylcarbamoyladenylate synthase
VKTQVITVDPLVPSPSAIDQAAAVLKAGGLVSFPTETVYGLGADALNPDAVGRIFAAKGRPAENPVIVHVADLADVPRVAAEWPSVAAELAARFWPGPLSFVVFKHPSVPGIVTAGGPTVAVRAPAHPVARALIRAAGTPIAAPSANASTHLSATRAEHVLRGLDGRIDLLLDGGPTAGGLESTVLDVTVSPPRLLRPGLVTPSEIEAVIGRIDGAEARNSADAPRDANPAAPLRSPGLLARHYAPRVPLECVPVEDNERIRRLCREHRRIGWLAFGRSGFEEASGMFVIEMPREAGAYAAQLYAALHTLEAAEVERIVVTLPPEGDGWLAIRDRLSRASVPA